MNDTEKLLKAYELEMDFYNVMSHDDVEGRAAHRSRLQQILDAILTTKAKSSMPGING